MSIQLSNINFTDGFQEEIDSHVKFCVKSQFESKYKEFVPIITSRLEDICQVIFKRLREGINNSNENFSFNIKIDDYYLDERTIFLIGQIFQKKLNINVDKCNQVGAQAINSLGDEICHMKGYRFVLPCYWTPSHPFYSNPTFRRYTYHPEAKSTVLFECAQKGIETDVTITSASKEKIPAHALILKTNSEYFKTMLNANMKESLSKEISLPYSTEAIKNLVQFIYQGQINASSHEISIFIELLKMSHEYEIKDLFNYSIDLILQFLNERPELMAQGELFVELVNCAYTYDLKEEFLEFALRAGERACDNSEKTRSLSSTSSSSATSLEDADSLGDSSKTDASDQTFVMDWQKIAKIRYIDLLARTVEYSLPRMKEELSRLINQLIQ